MHNKIASIILNSAKAAGLSDVYVSQPDAVKENLAGKIFLLAEIAGKKTDGRKIFDFLILALTDNYYNDEKILFRDKVEGLKLENIFEAAITKTNKDLGNFLNDEKIRLNPETTNLTLGVIYENKIHFSNFGRNRALLIYRHNSSYNLINVEANAKEEDLEEASDGIVKAPQLFSSVISGEIPASSYFIFASESLPEYLSGQDMINIVTELPPMTAAQQIKNTLGQINTYVPFLGIIIKNTIGLPQTDKYENLPDNSSAHNSISSLNHTEQKTEQMLSPAGMINFSKILKGAKKLTSKWLVPSVPSGRTTRYRSSHGRQDSHAPALDDSSSQPSVELSKVASTREFGSGSFLIKEKIFFKKKGGYLANHLKGTWLGIISIINPQRWPAAIKKLKAWFTSLNLRNRWLFVALGVLVVAFVVNMTYLSWRRDQAALRQQYDEALTALEAKEAQIEFYLLYNNQDGASRALVDAQAVIDSLPEEQKGHQEEYQQLVDRLRANEDKVQKISRISQPTLAHDLTGKNVNYLVAINDQLYASSGDTVYGPSLSTSSPDVISVADSGNLSQPSLNGADLISYWHQDRVIQLNPKLKTTTVRRFNDATKLANITGAKIYNNNFYTISKTSSQILRFGSNGGNFAAPTDWLKSSQDLNQATDLAIDGKIYVLYENGQVAKFNLGKPEEYGSVAIMPAISDAKRLIVGSKNLYFLSPASKRIIVLDKENGRLVGQYLTENMDNIKDFTVNDAAKKAFLLNNDQIYEINLN